MKNLFKLSKGFLSMPVAIVLAGIIIGVSVIYAVGKKSDPSPAVGPDDGGGAGTALLLDKIKPVASADHVRGDAKASVKVVEFSDSECPFCKRFHGTMQEVMKAYNAEVVWVYRHFPLDSLHPKARKEAEAMECAADIGGNDKFWAYTDRLYEITPSNNGLDAAELPKIAEYVGLNAAKFAECLKSGKHAERVANDLKDATETGGRGTPWSIVVGPSGKKYPVNGAYSVDMMKEIIDQALAEK